jgi:hypothetical protein
LSLRTVPSVFLLIIVDVSYTIRENYFMKNETKNAGTLPRKRRVVEIPKDMTYRRVHGFGVGNKDFEIEHCSGSDIVRIVVNKIIVANILLGGESDEPQLVDVV